MPFRTYRDINLILNGKKIFANSIVLNQEVDLTNPYTIGGGGKTPFVVGERNSIRSTPNKHKITTLDVSYYVTGGDFVKDYIDQNENFTLTGNLNGIVWNKGYLQSYSIDGGSDNPLVANARLLIADEISGTFVENQGVTPPDLKIVNYNDCVLIANSESEIQPEVITNYSWRYSAEVTPIFNQSETGISNSYPNRVSIGAKSIEVDLETDDENFALNFSGQPFSLSLQARSPISNISYETFDVSGRISKKTWGIANEDVSRSAYSISQAHTNNAPSIASVDTSFFSGTGYILIHSTDSKYGFFTKNENNLIVEQVFLADRECQFEASRGASFDTIKAYVPYDAINGRISIRTTKKYITYPIDITGLNFPQIVISGLDRYTGNFGDIINISGSNFYRISDVQISGQSLAYTESKDNYFTGSLHSVYCIIPPGAQNGIVNVISDGRLRTGSTAPQELNIIPVIENIFPLTGIAGTEIVISGYNFANIQEVLIGDVPLQSFTYQNYLITGIVPSFNNGYITGNITITGNNMVAISSEVFEPQFLIDDIAVLSGSIEEDLAIKFKDTINPLYFHQQDIGGQSGYTVSFGESITGVFFLSGSFSDKTITGFASSGVYGSTDISMFRPDKENKYAKYSGLFSNLTPAPIISDLGPTGVSFFNFDLYITGSNFRDFFGKDSYVFLSGHRDKTIRSYPNVFVDSIGSSIVVSGVNVEGGTGFYDVLVANREGTGLLTGAIISSGSENLARLATVSQFNIRPYYASTSIAKYVVDSFHPKYAVDSSGSGDITYAKTSVGLEGATGWYNLDFDEPINVSRIEVYRDTCPSFFYHRIYITNKDYFGFKKPLEGEPGVRTKSFIASKLSSGVAISFQNSAHEEIAAITGGTGQENIIYQGVPTLASNVSRIRLTGTGVVSNYWGFGVDPSKPVGTFVDPELQDEWAKLYYQYYHYFDAESQERFYTSSFRIGWIHTAYNAIAIY